MLRVLCLISPLLWSTTAWAWWDEGHMRVAAMAWEQLTPATKAEAGRLLKLNPDYQEWIAATPKSPDHQPVDVERYAFIRAAAWADDIKSYAAYQTASNAGRGHDKDEATTPFAGRNVGYKDLLIHGYWHFKDIGFTTDDSALPPADSVDAVTQMKQFIAALPRSANQTDDVRSYDLVWMLHLVGDIHQPLHATTLFTKDLTKKHADKHEPDTGDRGGNEIMVVPADGKAVSLHAYWDGLFGSYSTVYGALFDTFDTTVIDGISVSKSKLPAPSAAEAAIADPDVWAQQSFELAKKYAYAAPVLTGPKPELTREYETQARNAAEGQISLAAARLANVLNTGLGN